jgi:hypothetical protein
VYTYACLACLALIILAGRDNNWRVAKLSDPQIFNKGISPIFNGRIINRIRHAKYGMRQVNVDIARNSKTLNQKMFELETKIDGIWLTP